MNAKRILGSALGVLILASSAAALAAPAGSKVGKFDSFSEGARAAGGEIAASSLDNARSGDGSLYGYRV